MINPSVFLCRAILADAIFGGVSALLLTLGPGALAPLLNLPETLLRETGLFWSPMPRRWVGSAPGNPCRRRWSSS
jgi:hypothetical protein